MRYADNSKNYGYIFSISAVKTPLFYLLLIALITTFVYFPAADNGFTNWDDPITVMSNPLIRDLSPTTVKSCFTGFVMGNYHPLTTLSFAVDYHFGELDPHQYHRTNIILHVLNTLLVFLLVHLLFKKNLIFSVVVSLLFGVHPLHVESVAWVTERKDVLYAFFYFLAMICYVRYIKTQRGAFYFLALLVFILSLLSKGQAVTLPVVLLLLDHFCKRQVTFWQGLREKIPFFVLSIIFGIVAIVGSKESGAISEATHQHSLIEKFAYACFAFVSYVGQLIIPTSLSAFYAYPDRINGAIPLLYWWSLWVIPLTIAIFVLIFKKIPCIFLGLGFFLINIVLMLQIFPVGNVLMADRFAYVPSLGIFMVLASGVNLVAGKKGWFRGGIFVFFVLYATFLAVLTFQRCDVWQDSLSLWDDTLKKEPHSFFVYNLRGKARAEKLDYLGAIADYNRATELNPQVIETYYNRGNAKLKSGDLMGALADYKAVLRYRPDYQDATINKTYVVKTLLERCFSHLKLGRYPEAIEDCTHVIAEDTEDVDAYFFRAGAHFRLNRYEDAVADYSRVIYFDPSYEGAYFNRGMAQIKFGKRAMGCEDLKVAVRQGFAWAQDALIDYCQ